MKHLPNSMAFRLLSLKKYENQQTPLHTHARTHTHKRAHTQILTELELPLVNPESFVMALRLSVIQSPVTWVSLSVCVSQFFFLSVKLSQCHTKPCYMVSLCFIPPFSLSLVHYLKNGWYWSQLDWNLIKSGLYFSNVFGSVCLLTWPAFFFLI